MKNPQLQKENKKKNTLQKDLAYYRQQTAYVIDSKILCRMQKHLTMAESFLKKGEIDSASNSFHMAKREHILARRNRKVYYYRSWTGMRMTVGLLLVFGVMLLVTYTFLEFFQTFARFPVFLAALGGGIGARSGAYVYLHHGSHLDAFKRGSQEKYDELLDGINAHRKSAIECIKYLEHQGYSYDQAKAAVYKYRVKHGLVVRR